MQNFFLLSVLLLAATLSSAEAVSEYPPWKVGLSYEGVTLGIDLTPIGNESEKLTFRPSTSNYAGVILGYRWLAGTIAFAVPAETKIRQEEGQSRYTDSRISYYVRKWGIEAGYNNYKGYILENSDKLSAATLAGAKYLKLPEMQARGYGVNFFYVFDPGKYSMPAAFDQSEPQNGSAGTFVAIASVRHQIVENNGAIIPTEKASVFGTDASLTSIRSTNTAIGGGYGFLWDGPAAFFASAFAGLTGGVNYLEYNLTSSDRTRWVPQLNAHFRFAIGLNGKRGFLKLTGTVDYFNYSTSTIKIGNSVFAGGIAGGLRF